MSFNLPTQGNSFVYNLPLDFIPVYMEERYYPMLKQMRKPFISTLDYLNSTILDISWPSLSLPTSKQVMKYGKDTFWKGNQNIYDLLDKTATITFSNVDNNLNYLMIMECLMNNYLNTNKNYDSNIPVTLIDHNRRAIYFAQYRSVIFTSQEGNKLGYNDQQVSTSKTFSINFTFNYFDLEFVHSQFDVIINEKYGNHKLAEDLKELKK